MLEVLGLSERQSASHIANWSFSKLYFLHIFCNLCISFFTLLDVIFSSSFSPLLLFLYLDFPFCLSPLALSKTYHMGFVTVIIITTLSCS